MINMEEKKDLSIIEEAEPTSEELIASVIPEDGGIEERSKKPKKEESGGRFVFEFNKSTVKYFAGIAVLIIMFAWAINNHEKTGEILDWVSSILSPFILGFAFAFITNVVLRPIEKIYCKIFKKRKAKIIDKLRRPICLLLSTLTITGILFALLFIVIPEFIKTIQNLLGNAQSYIDQVKEWVLWLSAFAERHGISLPEMKFDETKILSTITNFINDNDIVDKTLTFTGSLLSGIVNLIVAIAFSLYLLAQKEILGAQAKKLMRAFMKKKDNVDKVVNLVEIVDRTFTNFMTGQLTEAFIIGILCFIGMLIFDMPHAAVISVLVGFTALIPVFGAFIGTGIGAFLILFESPMKALWFVIFIVVLQQLEGNLIYPKVVGKSVGLPGIWVLVAVTIGGTVGGVAGIVISVPACAVIYCLVSSFVDVRLKRKDEIESKQKKPASKRAVVTVSKKDDE